jgi:hypothetical protein
MYTIRLRLADSFVLYLNANKFNVIDAHNDLESNAYFLFSGKSLDGTICMPFVRYAEPATRISFDIATNSFLQVRLSLPVWETVRHLNEDSASSNFITVENLALRGAYTYCSETVADALDVLEMDVELTDPTCVLFSYYLKHFLSLKNNYLGVHQSHLSSRFFQLWNPLTSSLGHAAAPSNVLDAYVNISTKASPPARKSHSFPYVLLIISNFFLPAFEKFLPSFETLCMLEVPNRPKMWKWKLCSRL